METTTIIPPDPAMDPLEEELKDFVYQS